MLKLAVLFLSNWGVEKQSGGSQGEVIFDDKGGIYYDRDGNIIEGFYDDESLDGHGWENKGRRDWGEEALFWLDRAVRTDALFTLPTALHKRMPSRKSFSQFSLLIRASESENYWKYDGYRHRCGWFVVGYLY